MTQLIKLHLNNKKVKRLLIAPCGIGGDYKYLKQFGEEIYGIDIAPMATKQCPHKMIVKTADILESGYPDAYFDIIASPLFFHHYSINVGFNPFLKEFFRILKPEGVLIILDFSIYYPILSITRLVKKVFKNPYGEVDDEEPFRPKFMIQALRRNGFVNLHQQGATFNHCLFFIPLQKIINRITEPFLNKWPFKLFAWMVLFLAEKPNPEKS